MEDLDIRRDVNEFHGEWNYTFLPTAQCQAVSISSNPNGFLQCRAADCPGAGTTGGCGSVIRKPEGILADEAISAPTTCAQ